MFLSVVFAILLMGHLNNAEDSCKGESRNGDSCAASSTPDIDADVTNLMQKTSVVQGKDGKGKEGKEKIEKEAAADEEGAAEEEDEAAEEKEEAAEEEEDEQEQEEEEDTASMLQTGMKVHGKEEEKKKGNAKQGAQAKKQKSKSHQKAKQTPEDIFKELEALEAASKEHMKINIKIQETEKEEDQHLQKLEEDVDVGLKGLEDEMAKATAKMEEMMQKALEESGGKITIKPSEGEVPTKAQADDMKSKAYGVITLLALILQLHS